MQDIINFVEDFEKKLNKINSIENLNKIKKFYLSDILEGKEIFFESSRKKLLLKRLLLKLVKKAEQNIINNKTDENIKLNKVLLQKLYPPKALNKLVLKNSIVNRNIGNIPSIFFNNVEKQTRREVAKKIFKICADYSIDLLFCDFKQCEKNDLDMMVSERESVIKNFSMKLSNIINNNVLFQYVGRGYNGNVFKLTIDDKNFVYKCFFPFNYVSVYQHGRNAEPQFAYYASKYGNDRFAKFYFGKICSEFDYDGFIVAEYVDANLLTSADKKESLRDCCYNHLSIAYSETRKSSNTVSSKIVDFGGVIEVQPELKDKKIRYMVNLILNNIKYNHDKNLIKYEWKVDAKNIECIKNGIKKFSNIKDYKKALKVIKKYTKHFPKSLYKDLMKIFILPQNYNYHYDECLNLEELFNPDTESTKKKLQYFQLKFNSVDANPDINMDGYINVNLYDNKYAVINYNNEGITNIRFEELVGNEYNVIFKAVNVEDFRLKNSEYNEKLVCIN